MRKIISLMFVAVILAAVGVVQAQDLGPNIMRRIKSAETYLSWVDQAIVKGNDATGSLDRAKQEYANIFQYYKGSFDPNHPDIVALKKRIDTAEQKMKASVTAKILATPIESRSGKITGLPGEMGERLQETARDLRTLENRLATAAESGNPGSYYQGVKSDLKIAEDRFAQINRRYAGQFDSSHEAYVQVRQRLEKDRAAVDELGRRAMAATAAAKQTAQKKYDARAQAIMGKYKNQESTSALHRKNAGRIVWSTKPINLADQDKVEIRDTFKLTDPIFGRVYLARSLGNTPVYGRGGGRPEENFEFRYEFRLFIDGQEKADKFGVFVSSKLNGRAGESWTTWQFSPNPVPFDVGFKNEADAWRRISRGLPSGTHAVRFELWAVQGQFRSREPVSVGKFSLVVGKGDRIAAGTKFPGDTYSGGDLKQVRAQMKKALLSSQVAKSEDKILKIAVTSDWTHGRYTDTKNRYRKIRAAVLWADVDNDKVCRYLTYTFISDKAGRGWKPLRYRSFGGPEGEVECR